MKFERTVVSGLVCKALNDRYDPDARDGDSDGTVQEGSAFERPATARNPKGRGGRVRRAASRALDRLKPSRRRRRLRDGLGDIGDRGDMSAQERADSLGKRPSRLPDEGRRGFESPGPMDDETPEETMARLEAEFQKMREEDLFDWLGQDDDEVEETADDLLASLENMFNSMLPFEWEADLPEDGFTLANLYSDEERLIARDILRRLMITDEEIRDLMNGSKNEVLEAIFDLRNLIAAFRSRLEDPDSYSMDRLGVESTDDWFPDIARTVDFTMAERLSLIVRDLENRYEELSNDSDGDANDSDEIDPESAALWAALEREIDRAEADQRAPRPITDDRRRSLKINKVDEIPEPDPVWSSELDDWAVDYMARFKDDNPEIDLLSERPDPDDDKNVWRYDDMDDPGIAEWDDDENDFTVRTTPPKRIPEKAPDGIPQELWDLYRDAFLFADEPFDPGPPPLWDRQPSFIGWLAWEMRIQVEDMNDIQQINYMHSLGGGFDIVPRDEVEPPARLDSVIEQVEKLFRKDPKKWQGVYPVVVASRYFGYRRRLDGYYVQYRDPERLGERIPGALKPLTIEEFAERYQKWENSN